ncbi:hypothetical protein E4634_15590 [Mangrovimicrobium sediminis]|uniref:YhdP central domain-containing protein n=1 Tax=Mangrovimicrobium sediminis TaxID=2562682 RepID=A0A4Z0LY49_9GAMM|nr:DUF3971 domain-containing protein [Haliea sp. SAOS-164]TGD72096.1 hypothetical protein E4634_15590 [Haliea sp. SAOS-164]
MQQSIFHSLSRALWGLAITAIILLAVYVSIGRLLTGNLSLFQDQVLAALNQRLPLHVEAANVSGDWNSFTPEIALHDLRIAPPGAGDAPLQLIGGRIGIDVLDSLATRSLQFTSLQLEALHLRAELTADGRLVIPQLSDGEGEMGDWLREFLLNIEYLTLRDNTLELALPNGERRELVLDLHLSRNGSSRELEATLRSDNGTRLAISGSGLGDPFRPDSFVGEAYADIQSGQMESLAALFPNPPVAWPTGQMSGQLWARWDRGEPALDLELAASGLSVDARDGSWQLPLDALSGRAALRRERRQWTVTLDDLRASRDQVVASLPRLQLDAWERSLRVRAADVELAPWSALMHAASLPERWQSVFDALSPAGRLSALEMNTEQRETGRDWRLSGNFLGLAVDSWRGTPAVRGADGYFELSGEGGTVLIDSRDISLEFPTVYHAPQTYAELVASMSIDWDVDDVRLRSGLITARGEEGTVRALFGLTIPLRERATGIEMDLLVGLRDSDPGFRGKYVPYLLDAALLRWLEGAVGEGRVNYAGFIWRGSLKMDGAPLRTVQLFTDLAQTRVQYQPDWPAVDDFDGTLIVDDTNVSLWADSARLYTSSVQRLSAEGWMDADHAMRLAVDGEVTGPAADGLQVVRNSPLRQLTGGAFDDWSADGELATRLRLGLNLADSREPPFIDLQARVQTMDVGINPGNLLVENVAGTVHYDSERGFHARDLSGSLWGRPLQADVSQHAADGAGAAQLIDIEVRGHADTESLRAWLPLQPLELANGSTDVTVSVQLGQAQAPLLQVSSTLEGVALDLPRPWAKPAAEAAAFTLRVPLGEGRRELDLALDDALQLRLGLDEQAVYGATLGLAEPPPALRAGRVRVAGEADLVDVRAWQDFAGRYLWQASPGTATVADASADANADTTATADDAAAPALTLDLEDVYARQLLLWGKSFTDVTFSLSYGDAGLDTRFDAAWGGGEYRERPGQPALLALSALDLALLMERPDAPVLGEPAITVQAVAGESLPELAVTEVQAQRLLWHGKDVGQLQFLLGGAGGEFAASDITGSLAGLQLTPEQPAKLVWRDGGESRLNAPLVFGDFGDTLELLGYARTLETSEGRLDLDLAWPGAPDAFALAQLDGSMAIDVGEGSFLQTPGGTGALKVLELLNLAGVLQGLSLSHVFESGITFNRMDGEVYFHPGSIELSSLTVSGNSSAFAMSGVSDIATRSLDGELVATLPVANNLPWVAALAGGLPVAAGVFVFSKVFEKQVNRLSSGVYSIGGTWEAPEFAFDRMFDDELRLSGGAAPDPNTVRVPLAAGGGDGVVPLPAVPGSPAAPDPNAPLTVQEIQADSADAAPVTAPAADPNQPAASDNSRR